MYTHLDVAEISRRDHEFNYLYIAFYDLKGRCVDPDNPAYEYYGRRGITYSFTDAYEFALWALNNIGIRPEGHSLDRIDNDGHYTPGNLKWSTDIQQRANRREPIYATNTGERFISHTSANTFRVKVYGKYLGQFDSLDYAIKIRNSYLHSIKPPPNC